MIIAILTLLGISCLLIVWSMVKPTPQYQGLLHIAVLLTVIALLIFFINMHNIGQQILHVNN